MPDVSIMSHCCKSVNPKVYLWQIIVYKVNLWYKSINTSNPLNKDTSTVFEENQLIIHITKMCTFFYTILLLSVVFNVSSHPLSHQKHGRCAGRALNYLVSIPSLRECHNACETDERCCHYSHHESEEGGHHCFLYSREQCDINSLLDDEAHSHWRTGWRGGCSQQSIFHRARKTLVRMWGSERLWFVPNLPSEEIRAKKRKREKLRYLIWMISRRWRCQVEHIFTVWSLFDLESWVLNITSY